MVFLRLPLPLSPRLSHLLRALLRAPFTEKPKTLKVKTETYENISSLGIQGNFLAVLILLLGLLLFFLCSRQSRVGFEWSVYLYFSISPVIFLRSILYNLRLSKFARLAETPELAAQPKGLNFVQLPQDSCGSSLVLRCWEVVTTSAMLIHIVQHIVQSLGLQTPGATLASRKRHGISQRTLGPRISGWASESGRGTRTPPGHSGRQTLLDATASSAVADSAERGTPLLAASESCMSLYHPHQEHSAGGPLVFLTLFWIKVTSLMHLSGRA